jgi:hypothetical protein
MQGQIGHDRLCFCLHCAMVHWHASVFRASHRIIVLGLLGRGYFWYKHIPFTLASTSVIFILHSSFSFSRPVAILLLICCTVPRS